jgi:hypothetical protein
MKPISMLPILPFRLLPELFDGASPNGSEQSPPNGCLVDPSGATGTVWLMNQKHGITVFDTTTASGYLAESWSQPTVNLTPQAVVHQDPSSGTVL